MKNMSDIAELDEVYGRFFHAAPPAGDPVEVARLPKDVLVALVVTARPAEFLFGAGPAWVPWLAAKGWRSTP